MSTEVALVTFTRQESASHIALKFFFADERYDEESLYSSVSAFIDKAFKTSGLFSTEETFCAGDGWGEQT